MCSMFHLLPECFEVGRKNGMTDCLFTDEETRAAYPQSDYLASLALYSL